jgi:predicted exporter
VSGRSAGPSATSRAFVDWTLRWGKWLWAMALVLSVPATWRTAQLYMHLRSEFEQLLPRNAPSVLAIEELRARIPGLQHLGVVVDSVDEARLPAAERLLDDLADRVGSYPPELVRAVRTGDSAERKFLENHAPLYMDLDDLQAIRGRVEARRDWEASKQAGALLDEDEPAPPLALDDIRLKYESRSQGAKTFDDGRFASRKLHLALLLVQAGEFETGSSHGAALLERVRADLAALHPERYASGLRVGFTGDVAINVEELDALVADLSASSVVVVVLVVAAIVLYFQWWRSILILLPPLVLATVFAFAVSSLPPLGVTELNSNTAFLGSIIIGNGINFGIVLLARYVEERRRAAPSREALVLAVWGARTGTLSAALAAAVSYASLALTDFRGFRQFGWIGGLGMLFSWVLCFVLLPPLATWIDRAERLPPKRRATMPIVARYLQQHRIAIVVAACVLSVAAVSKARTFGSDQIETDFSKLRRADTWQNGEGYWGRRMDVLLGSYLTPTVILTDDEEQARLIGATLAEEAKRPPLDELIASVRTLDDVVPTEQGRKIAEVARIEEDLTPHIRASLTDEQRTWVDRLLGQGSLRPLAIGDLPETFTTGLRQRDGTIGREVLVFPRPSEALWQGAPLADLVARLRSAAAISTGPEKRPARVAGSLPLSADILDSLRRDGALASGAAFCGVVLVVLLLLRGQTSAYLVLASLVLAVLWLVGAQMALGIKINFANFIAYPITFGIGVDYSVNVASRWELDGRRSMADVVSTTGGAVALCSLTTVIGYGSLLLAKNRALFLFGTLAVLGEIVCISTALVVLPGFIDWVQNLRTSRASRA